MSSYAALRSGLAQTQREFDTLFTESRKEIASGNSPQSNIDELTNLAGRIKELYTEMEKRSSEESVAIRANLAAALGKGCDTLSQEKVKTLIKVMNGEGSVIDRVYVGLNP